MWVKITEKHLRKCPECLQLCLKIANPYDGEYPEDNEELGVCQGCIEDFTKKILESSLR